MLVSGNLDGSKGILLGGISALWKCDLRQLVSPHWACSLICKMRWLDLMVSKVLLNSQFYDSVRSWEMIRARKEQRQRMSKKEKLVIDFLAP